MLNLTSGLKAQPRREARVVVVGGGVAAARFASELVKRVDGAPRGGKALCVIVSAYPEGLVPYDRTVLSKEALDLERLTRHGARPDAFPWCGSAGDERQAPGWYGERSGVEVWGNTVCCGVQLDYRRLALRDLTSGATCEVMYEKLVVATGCRAAALDPRTALAGDACFWPARHADLVPVDGRVCDAADAAAAAEVASAPTPAEALDGAMGDEASVGTAPTAHDASAEGPAPAASPLDEARAPGAARPWALKPADEAAYGFGSVHTVRDVGDAVKVLTALNTNEEDGQETCADPVVIVGGGFPRGKRRRARPADDIFSEPP